MNCLRKFRNILLMVFSMVVFSSPLNAGNTINTPTDLINLLKN